MLSLLKRPSHNQLYRIRRRRHAFEEKQNAFSKRSGRFVPLYFTAVLCQRGERIERNTQSFPYRCFQGEIILRPIARLAFMTIPSLSRDARSSLLSSFFFIFLYTIQKLVLLRFSCFPAHFLRRINEKKNSKGGDRGRGGYLEK